jgi:hypothetical protein
MAEDLRARRLAAFDAHSRDFLDEARRSADAGDHLARRDIEGLTALADHVVRSLANWRDRLDRLELCARAPMSVALAARAVTEAVFDDLLEPDATRVLAAAIDLTV